MRLGFPDAGNDPPDTMTRQAYDLISEGFGPGTNGPLVIAAELPDSSEREGRTSTPWQRAARRRGRRLRHRAALQPGGSAAIVTVIPTTSPQDAATRDLVKRLRGTVMPEALDGTGVTAQVGGVTAALEDQSDYITDRMPFFIAGVVGLSFLLLLIAFHSPLISLKAAVMNLLSVSAAYGVMTLVAKGGAVGELIGIDHEVPIAPVHAGDDVRDPLRALDGLRGLPGLADPRGVPEGRRQHRRAVADGLAKTARVITAAAAIMVVVFLAFVASPEVFLKLFGIGLAVGDLPRRHRGPDGPGAGGDAAARRAATGGSRTGSSGSCRDSTSRTSRSVPREGPSRWPDWWSPSSSPSTG